jgi:hypothetical protein
MNAEAQKARRYHWHSNNIDSFVEEPHAAICSDKKVKPLNMVAEESGRARDCSIGLIKEDFSALLRDLKRVSGEKLLCRAQRLPACNAMRGIAGRPTLDLPTDYNSPPPYLPFDYKRVEKILVATKETDLKNFEDLLGKTSVGPATLRALALVSEIIYGAKPSYRDPVRYSFAHGGKDGYPYPVDREEYEKSISILQRAVSKAKLGQSEKLDAFKKIAD